MKKIIFLITGLFFSFCAVAQEIPKSDVVDASMPTGAKKITKEQLVAHLHNYKKSTVPLTKENTYQLDGLIISFWDLSVNPEFKRSLESTQSEMLGYLKWTDKNTINYSKIITINNIRFLTTEYQKENEVYLWFASEYNKQNKKINGVIQCKEPDKDKAEKALNDFLQTVHFKE